MFANMRAQSSLQSLQQPPVRPWCLVKELPLTPAVAASFAASLLFECMRALLPTTTWTNVPPLADLLPHTGPQQVAASPVENGVGLHLPYQKHILQVQQPSTIAAKKKIFAISQRNGLLIPRAQVCFVPGCKCL